MMIPRMRETSPEKTATADDPAVVLCMAIVVVSIIAVVLELPVPMLVTIIVVPVVAPVLLLASID